MDGPHGTWLLIGNSRWHWARATATGLCCWHTQPAMAGLGPSPFDGLTAWAAVGAVPTALAGQQGCRLQLEDVPLPAMPPWLGIDRALAAWQAAGEQPEQPVLVADAGTALSLTRVDRTGGFAGGRLLAGLRLQLEAMAAGTAGLPRPQAPGPLEAWPAATAAAMASGVAHGLAAAVVAAALEVAALEEQAGGGALRLWLTGGDGAVLLPLVRQGLAAAPVALIHAPDLCLRAMARLRPAGP